MVPAALETDAGPQQRSSRLALLVLAFAVLWAALWFVHTLGYWEDDSYIHLEFARSLARGKGFSFNGHVVYGDTSPCWVWLLTAFHAVIPNWMAAGKTLTLVAAVFALSGVYTLAKRQTRNLGAGRSALFGAAMVLVLVVNPYFGYWAFSGMEALAAAGLVCWALVAVSGRLGDPIGSGRFLLGCLCAGIAPLLRPEMGFLTILLGLVLFVRWANLRLPFWSKLLLFFSGFALVAAPGVAWAVYAARTFGSILPNTDAAKRAGPEDSVIRHLLQIYAFGFPLVLLGLLGLGIWQVRRRMGRSPVSTASVAGALEPSGWAVFAWTALNCVFYVVNHTYVQTRYIFVTATVMTVLLFAIAGKLWPRLFVAGAVFGVIFGVSVSFLATWPLIRNKVAVDRAYARLADFMRHLPPDAPVAHYSIGEAAFLSEHPIVDLGGITRPGVIPFLWDATDARRIWWAHEQGTRYYVTDHAPEPGSTLVYATDIPTTGWFLNPHRYRAFDHLMVWKLPLSPTLSLPPDMPREDVP